jgi:hypothetical protein
VVTCDRHLPASAALSDGTYRRVYVVKVLFSWSIIFYIVLFFLCSLDSELGSPFST